MRFVCPLIVVNDIRVSLEFYEKVLEQRVQFDFGENVEFEGGFAIHQKSHFSGLINVDPNEIPEKPNNFELYFEEENLDDFVKRLEDLEGKEYVHPLREQPWGQRVIRFYDPDKHIVEVGEPMESVARRFLKQGLSVEETAERISMPKEFVENVGV